MSEFMFKDDRIGPGIPEARAEMERMTGLNKLGAVEDILKANSAFIITISNLESKLALSRALIEEYAQHAPRCACRYWGERLSRPHPIDAEGCDCGLAEKWKELNK
jgi:hypothetical protein